MSNQSLFTPLTLANGVTIKNRIVKPAMSEEMGDKLFRPTAKLVNLYRRWAQGGTGLLITGNVMIDSRARGEMGNVVVEDDRDLEMLKKWAVAGTENGTQLWMQLNHPGKQSPKNMSSRPVAPSAVPLEGDNAFAFNSPRALTRLEIKDIIQRFIRSAQVAQKAGFTGVEIHAAHGYLLNQFLSPHDNQRQDEYGGSLENRMRILVDIYTGMRAAVGSDFPIGFKINSSDFRPDGLTEAESLLVIEKMADLGVDLIEISGGNYENPRMQSIGSGAFFVDYAAKVKREVNVPVCVTGGFRSVTGMETAIASDQTDFVGMARPLALMSDLPNQIQAGRFDQIQLEHLSTGIKALDKKVSSLIGLSYYQEAMHRIAMNQPVKRTTNAWRPLWFAIKEQGPSVFLPNRA